MMDLHDEINVDHLHGSNKRIHNEERIKLNDVLAEQRPIFLQASSPGWWRRTLRRVLAVMVSPSNPGVTGTGSSEFTTTYKELDTHDRSD